MMYYPTGRQFELRSIDGRATAEVAQVGAALRAFAVDGVDLVPRYPREMPTPVASGVVLVPWPNRVRDGKWTQRGQTRQLAITHADKGITINAIGPGAIQTNLRANTVKILGADAPVMRGVGGDDAAVRAIMPAGRRGTLEEVAATAVFLASREASYVTGHTLMVDGGWTAR